MIRGAEPTNDGVANLGATGAGARQALGLMVCTSRTAPPTQA